MPPLAYSPGRNQYAPKNDTSLSLAKGAGSRAVKCDRCGRAAYLILLTPRFNAGDSRHIVLLQLFQQFSFRLALYVGETVGNGWKIMVLIIIPLVKTRS